VDALYIRSFERNTAIYAYSYFYDTATGLNDTFIFRVAVSKRQQQAMGNIWYRITAPFQVHGWRWTFLASTFSEQYFFVVDYCVFERKYQFVGILRFMTKIYKHLSSQATVWT
jgi:hypothetical protein